jgi:hypothetical protein
MATRKCPFCQQALVPGVQHVCPAFAAPAPAPAPPAAVAVEQNGRMSAIAWWKLFLPFAGLLVLQLGGAIWWASAVQSDLRAFKDQLANQESYFKEQLNRQQTIIDRLDAYFRRPPP